MKRLCACAALAGVFGWAAAAAPVTNAVKISGAAGAPATAEVVLRESGPIAAGDRNRVPASTLGAVLAPVVEVTEDSVARRTDVPEPAAYALIGSALLALGMIRKRRQV